MWLRRELDRAMNWKLTGKANAEVAGGRVTAKHTTREAPSTSFPFIHHL